MPKQHLDADSKAIVELADVIAHEFEMEYVGTEHVLLAILRHGGGLGAAVLAKFGIDEAKARRKIEDLFRRDKEDTWVFGRLPGSPHYRNVIELAISEAEQLEAREIRSEHLLLALLREKHSTAYQALAALGVTLKSCRDEVLRHLAEA